MPDFRDVVAGDTVTRILGGYPMLLRVTSVDEHLIHCGPSGWTFDRLTGAEVDDDLGWGPAYGITGSYLVKEDWCRLTPEGGLGPTH